ncbi:MAG TPA: hypothetical protein VHI77_04905 [Solirubrobacterales bacterium]|nr:hypothetical protein [Solirubrobacterales bacterium]
MRRLASSWGLVAALALAAATPTSAAASTLIEPAVGGQLSQRHFEPEISLRRGRYWVTVGARGAAVALTVVSRHASESAAASSYVAKGTATGKLVWADFGRFGRISLRFHATGPPPKLTRARCHGHLTRAVRQGVFVGTLRFRGEDGYVAVDVHRVKGRISRLLRCRRHHHGNRRRPLIGVRTSPFGNAELPFLAAQWKTATAAKTFVALKDTHSPFFVAMTVADAGLVSVYRVALALGHGPELRLNGALTAGRASPGSPFSGEATYSAGPDGSHAWEGSLAVSFPGAEEPLTGAPLETAAGTLPPLTALFLLRHAERGDAISLAGLNRPSLLRPR